MYTFVLMSLGGALTAAALVLSNSLIEQALLREPGQTLQWGPMLFRVLLAAHGLVLWARGWCGWRAWPAPPHLPPAVSPGTAAAPPATDWMPWGIVLVLSILALGLRLLHSDGDLWYDEVLTLVDGVRPPFGDIVSRVPSHNQPMLYAVMAHATTWLWGESAWTVRLPSVMFGVASLWGLFLCGRLIVGTRTALLSCALMTVSYHHLWFSQNASSDTGLLFFTTLGTWLWLEGLARGSWPWWVSYAISVALGFGLHRSMTFVLAAHGFLYLLLLLRAPRTPLPGTSLTLAPGWRWQPWVAWALCGSLTLQLYALALPELFRSAWLSDWPTLLWSEPDSLQGLRLGSFGRVVVLASGVLAGLGWLNLLHRHWVAGVALLLPPVLAGVTLLKLDYALWPGLFFTLAFALLLIVHGAMTASHLLCQRLLVGEKRQHWGTRLGLGLAFLCIAISTLTVPRTYVLPKQNFTGARSYVEQRLQSDEEVVAVGVAGMAYKRYFAPHWTVVESRAHLEAVLRTYASVWLVSTMPMLLKHSHADLWQAITHDFERVKVFPGTLVGGEIYVYRLRTSKTALGRPQAQEGFSVTSKLLRKDAAE